MLNWGWSLAFATAFCVAGIAADQSLCAQSMDAPAWRSVDAFSTDATWGYDPVTDEALYLLVSVNGQGTGLIAEFKLSRQSNRMSARRSELERVGISAPRNLSETLFLDHIPGLAYNYDAPTQTLHLTADAAVLVPAEISATPRREMPQVQTGFGLVLNYRVSANLGYNVPSADFRRSDAFAGLELRAYTPLGVLTQTGSVSAPLSYSGQAAVRRHDTYFTSHLPGQMLTLTAGDFTTTGLAWTRPVRMGGLQARRDFSLRNDVVTNPLLSYSGTATVPSTIDVFVDNLRAYSGAIPAGPFNLTDVPMITSSGEAVFVIRDAGGNEQSTTVPFFATQNLLARGTLDYSLNIGRLRQTSSNGDISYDDRIARAASLRYGLSDRLTVEAHAEAINDMWMAGLGLSTALFNRAEVTLAAGKSANGDETGSFAYGTLRTELAGIQVNLSSTRYFGNYQDLASTSTSDLLGISQGPVKALDALSLTFPIFANEDRIGLRVINSERKNMTNTFLHASYYRQLPGPSAALRVSAFQDVVGDGGSGISVSLSFLLGPETHARAGLRRDRSGNINPVASLSQSADRAPGSFGYRIALSHETAALRATYQTSYGRGDLALRDSSHGTDVSARLDGALVLAGGGLFASNRVVDGFAIVNVGVPDVPVSLNNRLVAETGPFGRAIVPNLTSFRVNRISINPLALPLDANLVATAQDVVPARHSGVTVDFEGNTDSAALVVLQDAAGTLLQPGSTVRLEGNSTPFTVGYDGEVWIEGLGAQNHITVETSNMTCAAEFTYAKTSNAQVYIDGVECR